MRSLQKAGARVVGGSDWIYGPIDPLVSMEAMLTRQNPCDATGMIDAA